MHFLFPPPFSPSPLLLLVLLSVNPRLCTTLTIACVSLPCLVLSALLVFLLRLTILWTLRARSRRRRQRSRRTPSRPLTCAQARWLATRRTSCCVCVCVRVRVCACHSQQGIGFLFCFAVSEQLPVRRRLHCGGRVSLGRNSWTVVFSSVKHQGNGQVTSMPLFCLVDCLFVWVCV